MHINKHKQRQRIEARKHQHPRFHWCGKSYYQAYIFGIGDAYCSYTKTGYNSVICTTDWVLWHA